MLNEPAWDAVPVAVSWVLELKTVASGAPFHWTTAPLTNRLPTTFIVNGPKGIGLGTRLVVQGI
jgi:hypothetical protein